jgi:hypothetical protein
MVRGAWRHRMRILPPQSKWWSRDTECAEGAEGLSRPRLGHRVPVQPGAPVRSSPSVIKATSTVPTASKIVAIRLPVPRLSSSGWGATISQGRRKAGSCRPTGRDRRIRRRHAAAPGATTSDPRAITRPQRRERRFLLPATAQNLRKLAKLLPIPAPALAR